MKKLFVTIILVTLSISTYAEKIYTPSQLNRMVDDGQYP